MFYLVCFDIVDDKDRRKAVKVLKEYGVWVQKSVFECANLTEKRFLRMKDQLDGTIDQNVDTVRYYFLCGACLERVEHTGIGEGPLVEDYKVV